MLHSCLARIRGLEGILKSPLDRIFKCDHNVVTIDFILNRITIVVKARIIKVGNSQGVRIPKLLLEQSGIKGDVEIEVQQNQLIIRRAQLPREDWGEAFKSMAELNDDCLLDGMTSTQWEETDWEWS